MRFAELFAGAGGLSLGLEQAGHECVFHAEIEPHARAVLRHQWPDVPLYGDVTTLNGRELVERHGPIDLLSGGSPCQDLSVAGKRAGLEGARSGLFHQQLRLWRETGADLLLWENVMGALSSQGGADFHTVLEELSGTDCIRPDDGWPTAGVIRDQDGRARVAYRCLDLQWFGPPQRRRRVFVLAVRADALDRYDPAALLFADTAGGRTGTAYRGQVHPERQGVSGGTAAGGTAREGTAGGAGAGAAFSFEPRFARNDRGGLSPVVGSLKADSMGDGAPCVVNVVPLLEVGARTGTSTDDPRAGIGIGNPGDPLFTLQATKQHGVAFGFPATSKAR